MNDWSDWNFLVKGSYAALAIVLGWATAALAATPGTLTSLRAIHALTNDEARQGIPALPDACQNVLAWVGRIK